MVSNIADVEATAFLFTGVVLLGGVADPPAARAAAPMLSQDCDRKNKSGYERSVAPLPRPSGLVSEVLPCLMVDRIYGDGHHVRSLVSSLHFVPLRASSAHFMPWFFRLYRGDTDGQDFVAMLLVIACSLHAPGHMADAIGPVRCVLLKCRRSVTPSLRSVGPLGP